MKSDDGKIPAAINHYYHGVVCPLLLARRGQVPGRMGCHPGGAGVRLRMPPYNMGIRWIVHRDYEATRRESMAL